MKKETNPKKSTQVKTERCMESLSSAVQNQLDTAKRSRQEAELQRQQNQRDEELKAQERFEEMRAESSERVAEFLSIMHERHVPQVIYCRSGYNRDLRHETLTIDEESLKGWIAVDLDEFDENEANGLNRQGDNPKMVTLPGVFVDESGRLYACKSERLLSGRNVVGNLTPYLEEDPTLLAGDGTFNRMTTRIARILDPTSGYPERVPVAEQQRKTKRLDSSLW